MVSIYGNNIGQICHRRCVFCLPCEVHPEERRPLGEKVGATAISVYRVSVFSIAIPRQRPSLTRVFHNSRDSKRFHEG